MEEEILFSNEQMEELRNICNNEFEVTKEELKKYIDNLMNKKLH